MEAITVESHILLFCRSSLCCFYCMKYPFRHYINSLMLKFLIDARTISNVFLFILRDKGERLRRIPHTSHGSFNPYLNQYILRKHLQASSCLILAVKITAWSGFSNISWERKPFKSQSAVQWFSFAWDVYFIFHSNLRIFLFFCFCFTFKINIEIIKIVLLSIFNHEKRQLLYLLDWKPVTSVGPQEMATKISIEYYSNLEMPVPK